MCGLKIFKGSEKASYGIKDAKGSQADIPGLQEDAKVSSFNENYKKIKTA